MDTSKEYIKMCEKAGEIQNRSFKDNTFKGYDIVAVYSELQEPEKFPNFAGYPSYQVYYVDKWHRMSDKNAEYRLRLQECGVWQENPRENTTQWYGVPECLINHKYIWLPRQDQLQEFIKNDYVVEPSIMKDLLKFQSKEAIEARHYKTFEQIWLAYVMKENFNKVWDFKNQNWLVETAERVII